MLAFELLEPSHPVYALRPTDPPQVTRGFSAPHASFCHPRGEEKVPAQRNRSGGRAERSVRPPPPSLEGRHGGAQAHRRPLTGAFASGTARLDRARDSLRLGTRPRGGPRASPPAADATRGGATATHHTPTGGRRPPRLPGFILGLGLGGFLDGIVLHQVLQWHHLVSDTAGNPVTTVDGLEANTLADGLFHLATWVFVLVGTALALRAWQRGELAPPWRSHAGLLLAGWGAFNLVEGVVDHQILGIHHVRDDLGGPLAWDLGFLVLGALLVAGGVLLARSGERIAPGGSRPERPSLR